MEWQRAEGIVLRRQPVTETSLVVTWFTPEFGKLKTMAKGARRIKGPFTGKIDLFYQDEIVFLPSRRSDLHLLHECFVISPRVGLRHSLERLAAATYAVELVELIAEGEDPHVQSYTALATVLDALLTCRQPPVLLIWLALQLLTGAGWQPRWGGQTGMRRMLHSIVDAGPEQVQRIVLTDEQQAGGLEVVGRFWLEHVGRAPRSAPFLTAKIRR